MDLKELISFADELIYTKTGKHLDDIQQTVLQGILQGKRYSQIAEENNYAQSYVRNSASELWKIFSEALGEDIKQSNFRATFQRLRFYKASNFVQDIVHIGDVNFCNKDSPPTTNQLQSYASLTSHIDLDKASTPETFYGRTEELNTLEKWIVEEQGKLVTVAGLNGIGKTSLTLKLIENIKAKFSYIIYRNLNDFDTLTDLQTDLIESLLQLNQDNDTNNRKQKSLIYYLRSYRCLIILDDAQILFKPGELAGEYQTQYQDYGSFFDTIGKVPHQSCIILNTWEIPREVIKLIADKKPVHLLRLQGLGEAATEILQEQDLLDKEKWLDLIILYQGHPLALKLVSVMIEDLFNQRVSEYLKFDSLILPEDVKAILKPQLEQLSEVERKVVIWMSAESQPVSISKLLEKNSLSPSVLFNTLQSLYRRSLIQKQDNSEVCFAVTPMVREYVLNQFAKIY